MFFGIERRMGNEEMEEQLNKGAKQGWKFAADAARITDGNASSEDRKHTSGGVFVAFDCNLGECQRRYASLFRLLLALGKRDTEK